MTKAEIELEQVLEVRTTQHNLLNGTTVQDNAQERKNHLHNLRASITPLSAFGATPCGGYRPSDPAVFSCRDPRGWIMPRGRPHASWLRQVETYLKDMGIAGLTSAWAMARRRKKEYRRKVDAATRSSGACPHT